MPCAFPVQQDLQLQIHACTISSLVACQSATSDLSTLLGQLWSVCENSSKGHTGRRVAVAFCSPAWCSRLALTPHFLQLCCREAESVIALAASCAYILHAEPAFLFFCSFFFHVSCVFSFFSNRKILFIRIIFLHIISAVALTRTPADSGLL